VLNRLDQMRTQLAALLQSVDAHIAAVRTAPNNQALAHHYAATFASCDYARELVDQARTNVTVDCWCDHWSPRGNHVRFASVLIAHRPNRRDIHSVVYILDGREVLRATATQDSAQGTVAPGPHRLEAITTLQSGRKLTTRGSFNVGPPWALAIEHRLTSSGSRFSRQRLPDPLRQALPGVP
jgi:hypothetical protein